MFLVLCPSTDLSALWAYQGLLRRGLAPLELISAEVLGYSLRWEHRLGAGGVMTDVSLADGRRFRGEQVRGVLNRLQTAPTDQLAAATPEDREYAAQEVFAFFLSWLHALPGPVLNPPTPQGLCGRWRHASEWALLASRAGLDTLDYRWDPAHATGFEPATLALPGTPVTTVFVAGDRVVGESLPPEVEAACRALAEAAGAPLLGIDFTAGPGGPWTFAAATPMPDLRLGGEPLLDVLADTLRNGGQP